MNNWTFMVYLAGDNDLEKFGIKDLNEMKAVGSDDNISIIAQFDRMSDQQTKRYYLTSHQSLEEDCVATLPETNTGDPKALIDFVNWACNTYSAENYALVLWNHGSGWKDDDIYAIAKARGWDEKIARGQVRSLSSRRRRPPLFSTTVENIVEAAVERGILYDDSSADFLDSIELKKALQKSIPPKKEKFDLLGFDACLMSMLEVNYQIKGQGEVAVGSQANEPGDGWPYDTILARLSARPEMDARALAKVIVEEYTAFYRNNYPPLSITQSAINLEAVDSLGTALSTLGDTIRNDLQSETTFGLIHAVLRYVQRFDDPDYIDLKHFCQLLVQNTPDSKIGGSAKQILEIYSQEDSMLLANDHHGPMVGNAMGISVYLPTRSLSLLYKNLDFAKEHQWDEFLHTFLHPEIVI